MTETSRQTSTAQRIVIAGNGLAAWMAAAALRKAVSCSDCSICVVGDDTVDAQLLPFGFADATMPSADRCHAALDLDENRIVAASGGTFTLGIAFGGWSGTDESYFHPFGSIGASLGPLSFHNIVMKLRRDGTPLRLANYSLAALAAQAGRFARPVHDMRSVLSTCQYGLHLDCVSLTSHLRAEAASAGVNHVQGALRQVDRSDDGAILSLLTADGEQVAGDLFLDCTGVDALLIEHAADAAWQDWSQWFPCDRVVSAIIEAETAPSPYSYAEAGPWGWTRHVPLQGRTVLAAVYSSGIVSDDEALEHLQASAVGRNFAAAEPVAVRFGRRRQSWQRNCVALAAAAALVDPVGMTNLQLLRSAISRLLALLPGSSDMTVEAAEYNRQTALQTDHARDFAMLHYKLNGRHGETLWDACRNMPVPESLAYRMQLYESRGRVVQYDEEPMDETSWINLFDANGVYPRHYSPIADGMDPAQLQQHVDRIRAVMIDELGKMPLHADYLSALEEDVR